MTTPRPFRIAVPDETLDRIRARVAAYEWHEMPDDGGWAYGANLDYMKELSPEGRRVEVPTGCALHSAEFLAWPPRSYVERVYNVTHWAEMPRGGHFAAMEQPELFVEDLRAFARSLR